MMRHQLTRLKDGIKTGKAILFTGAGFSRECTNIGSSEILDAKQLSYKICDLGLFEASDDLMYSSGRYLSEKEENKNVLIDFLKKNYTVKDVKHYVEKISLFKWSNIYTTNYDNTIEFSCQKNSKKIVPLDMEQKLSDVEKINNKCIHINGYIKSLNAESLNGSFKLSNSSYCTTDGFISSPWYTFFKRNIERCSALVFVGYSLYDIDIKKILKSLGERVKERTFFITSPNCSQKDLYEMSMFGHVFDIGAEEFANLLPDPTLIKYPPYTLDALSKFSASHDKFEVKDRDIDRLLLYGDYEFAAIENNVFSNSSSEYVVLRDALTVVKDFIVDSNVVIVGELGNGKTIFLQELIPYLSPFYDVYSVKNYYGDIISDISYISKKSNMSIIIVDDYTNIMEIFDSYHIIDHKKIKFVLSSRHSLHEKSKNYLKELGFTFKEISVDQFSKCEAENLFKIIDTVGFWGIANNKISDKNKYFSEKCRSQLSALLIDSLSSPDIKDRIRQVFNLLIYGGGDTIKNILFTTAFLSLHNIRTDLALVSEITGNAIYDSEVRTNALFSDFFKFDYGYLKSKSSIFSQALIRSFFNPEYTMDRLLNISKVFDKKKKMSEDHNKIFKATLKFSIVERLLPDENKKSNLENYYDRLKRKVEWLINDPHYWVQYAMTKIPYYDYEKAQQYINNAYEKAHTKYNYTTSNIDTQQARLLLLQASQNESTIESFSQFLTAHKLLRDIPNDIYKLRQMNLYADYFFMKEDLLDEVCKKKVIYAFEEMLRSVENMESEKVQHPSLMKIKDIIKIHSNLKQ